jgi:8-oxo-dGTP pyrophosphatase MutT (NUDIX family)
LPNDDEPHGYMLSEVVNKMPWTAAFDVKHSHPWRVTVLDNSEGKDTANVVNAAFSAVISTCIEQNLFHVLDGARYDLPVYIERFATALFGVTTRGAHLVAYRMGEKGMNVWVPRRSAHLYTYPNMLDTTVAGGVKSGVPPFQTIVEEADEEASLPEAFIRQKARCRGVISHMNVTGKDFPGEQGLVTPDYVYVYDIELPEDVIPKPHDDEVSNFTLMSAEELQAALLREEFKPDSAAVLIDFLIRHEIITPDNEPDFVEISMRLHRRLPFRTG